MNTSGKKEHDETPPLTSVRRPVRCVLWICLRTCVTSFVRGYDQLPGLISPKWWAYWDFYQLRYTHTTVRVTHTQTHTTHTALHMILGWVTYEHPLYIHTDMDWLMIAPVCWRVCVSILSLICGSFGWIMCSCTQHANLILSPPMMPARLYQISLSFSLSASPFQPPLHPSFYSHRNVWYVDQQTGCVIFLLSSGEKARRGRGGGKQTLLPPPLKHPSSPLSLPLT